MNLVFFGEALGAFAIVLRNLFVWNVKPQSIIPFPAVGSN